MNRIGIGRIRLLLSAASLATMAACLLIVLVAMTPSGEWITIEGEGMPTISSEESGFVLRYSAEATSHMPYDLEDLEGELYLTDPVRGSRALICEFEGVCIPAGRTSSIGIESGISAVTAALIVRDLAVKDGAPLHFDLVLSCSYLLGMADFRLETGIDVPVTAPGEKLSHDVFEDTKDSFGITVDGLAGWLLPDDGSLLISDGIHEAYACWSTTDGTLSLRLSADDLDDALDSISRSGSARIVYGSGVEHVVEDDDVRSLIDLLRILGRKA